MKFLLFLYAVVWVSLLLHGCRGPEGTRTEISLNGDWEITKTASVEEIPFEYQSNVPVPGLVDLAQPAIDTGNQYQEGIYWHKRGFTIDKEYPQCVILRIAKAKYHARIYLNDRYVGEHVYCFTPGEFDIRDYLNPPGTENELVIALGTVTQMPDTVIWGHDFEKISYIPGIYDNVTLILSDLPAIRNIQTVPLIDENSVRIVADLDFVEDQENVNLSYEIRELASGKRVARGTSNHTDFSVSIPNAQLWTPETPFLYELALSTEGDMMQVRFGMRSFEFDTESKRAMLNGKPYYMRGTNVCIFRFFEDSERSDLPWDDQWPVDLHNLFKDMHWNSIRYCIGFPPERWYDIADSLGFLIQDEYPIWTLNQTDQIYPNVTASHLASEYRSWIRAHWNHPCVVIWDAQNESGSIPTGEAISMVRDMDLSGRPWDNGWLTPGRPGDPMEEHPYLFMQYFVNRSKFSPEGVLKDLLGDSPGPNSGPNKHDPAKEDGTWYDNPIIINEYAWLWLNRDGSPTTVTDRIYEEILENVDTKEERWETYARYLGILTEYWRTQRLSAGVLHFSSLTYTRPDEPRGWTSDHFIDVSRLELEPNFIQYVRPAFAPVGLMIRFWEESIQTGEAFAIDVVCINDTDSTYTGTLEMNCVKDGHSWSKGSQNLSISPYGRKVKTFMVFSPDEPGVYELVAEITFKGEPVKSIRKITVRD